MADTVCSKFIETVARHPNRVSVEFRRKGTWLELTWASYIDLVYNVAAGLASMGIKRGDRVAIWSNTRVEWAICDLAILSLGAVTVPIYQNSSKDDVEFTLADAKPKAIFCESPQIAARAGLALGGSAKKATPVIWFEPSEGSTSIDDLQARGATKLAAEPKFILESIAKLALTDLATIVYTSGTTGRPRGVALTHAQVMSEASEAFPLLGITSTDKSLTFLPFAHVLGRVEIWGHALIGYTMAYAESVDRLKDNLQRIKPTVMMAVPRIFEKIHQGILAQAEISPMRKRIFDWALDAGLEISHRKEDKLPAPIDVALKYRLAQKLVFNPILQKLGGRLRFCVIGGAPMSRPVAEFFHAAGLLLLEGYGLTETTAAVCVNTPFDYRFGTVGKPVGDVKLRIAPEDGEILVSSKKVMKEYLEDPLATEAAFVNGWFRTGDIGEITAEGHLRITDRKKDLIKTAGGKYVAPQKLEGLLRASPVFSNVVIIGDQRKYVVALVTLNPSAGVGEAGKEVARKAIAEANTSLASFESIKNFAVLPKELTVEGGELTPSLKVKRKVVEERYRDVIERLYGAN